LDFEKTMLGYGEAKRKHEDGSKARVLVLPKRNREEGSSSSKTKKGAPVRKHGVDLVFIFWPDFKSCDAAFLDCSRLISTSDNNKIVHE